jgi:hypothetical protein
MTIVSHFFLSKEKPNLEGLVETLQTEMGPSQKGFLHSALRQYYYFHFRVHLRRFPTILEYLFCIQGRFWPVSANLDNTFYGIRDRIL